MPTACTPPPRAAAGNPPNVAKLAPPVPPPTAPRSPQLDDLAARTGRAGRRRARGVRVREVVRDRVHPQPLGREARGGDVERVEEAHQCAPVITVSMVWRRLVSIAITLSNRSWFLARFADLGVDVDVVAVGAHARSSSRSSSRTACASTADVSPPLDCRASARARLERDVGALEARRVDVREVVREHGLALLGAVDARPRVPTGDVEKLHDTSLEMQKGRPVGRPSVDTGATRDPCEQYLYREMFI